ncbi:PREDICTED: putative gustatory receptor 28a [Trachymyrmex cornetzi]|uniref:putative gustatory receptor 28a n=1 Tax=Trachymyrmex cornetzi TaxID=471704 RepID=UPI00084F8371|nr:PREDICTED: putative gustatory receptor 28a [Trachymyrmex cornetzi]
MFNLLLKFQAFISKRKGKIWQLFCATDFESLMYPCFTFCRILGIFPYKINASTIKPCKLYYILSTIVFCTFCVDEIISIYDVNISKNIAFRSVPRILQLNCFHIFGGFIVAGTFILSGPRMRLLQTILNLSLRLPPATYKNISKLIHAKDIFGFFFLITQALIFSPNMQDSVFRLVVFQYIILLVFQMDMLYMNCVCVLKACFKQINDNLMNLRRFVAHREPYFLREIYQKHPFLLMELKALEKQHLTISDTVQMLTTTFSLQLLCTIILTFIQITFYLYFYLIRIQRGDSVSQGGNLERQVYYKTFITAITYYTIKTVMLVWACETSKNQAMEIGVTVRNMFNSISNKEIKYELQLFSLQLMHRENIFSAKGFIVDATLLTAMVGSITMYLLILIQFLLMSNSCDEETVINFIHMI